MYQFKNSLSLLMLLAVESYSNYTIGNRKQGFEEAGQS